MLDIIGLSSGAGSLEKLKSGDIKMKAFESLKELMAAYRSETGIQSFVLKTLTANEMLNIYGVNYRAYILPNFGYCKC